MKFINELVLAPAGTNVNGPAIYSALLLYVSVSVSASGSSTSAVKLQASNDAGNPQNNFVPKTWIDIPSATVTLAGATAIIPKTEICYNWIRVVHTGVGTGTNTINVFAQGA